MCPSSWTVSMVGKSQNSATKASSTLAPPKRSCALSVHGLRRLLTECAKRERTEKDANQRSDSRSVLPGPPAFFPKRTARCSRKQTVSRSDHANKNFGKSIAVRGYVVSMVFGQHIETRQLAFRDVTARFRASRRLHTRCMASVSAASAHTLPVGLLHENYSSGSKPRQ